MTGTAITIDVDAKPVADILKRIKNRMGSMRPALENVGEIILESVRDNFELGGRPAWKPLSDRTLLTKKNDKILENKGWAGGLLGSIQPDVGDDYVMVGTDKEYAAVHQFGMTGSVNVKAHTRVIKKAFGKTLPSPVTVSVRAHSVSMDVPARPFLMIQSNDMVRILDELTDFIME